MGITSIIPHHLLGARLTHHTQLFLASLPGCNELLFRWGNKRPKERIGLDPGHTAKRTTVQVSPGSAVFPTVHSPARVGTH